MLPVVVHVLLAAKPDREPEAWAAFAEEYSPLLLHVARSLGGDRDAIMDRYAYLLEQLRADGGRRLRGYRSEGTGSFTTWLVVVGRRLCLDFHRRRYGRDRGAASAGARAERRALVDLVAADIDAAQAVASPAPDADSVMMDAEVRHALSAALGELAPEDRLLLRYRFEDELSVPEIARLTGEASAFVLYRRIDRILRALRRDLLRAGIETRSA